MAGVLVQGGEVWALNLIVQANDQIIVLYTNSITITNTTVLSDLVLVDPGSALWYTTPTLAGWTFPLIDGSGHAYSLANNVQYISDGSDSTVVRGYAIVDASSQLILYYAENFASPISMAAFGDAFIVTPKLVLFSFH